MEKVFPRDPSKIDAVIETVRGERERALNKIIELGDFERRQAALEKSLTVVRKRVEKTPTDDTSAADEFEIPTPESLAMTDDFLVFLGNLNEKKKDGRISIKHLVFRLLDIILKLEMENDRPVIMEDIYNYAMRKETSRPELDYGFPRYLAAYLKSKGLIPNNIFDLEEPEEKDEWLDSEATFKISGELIYDFDDELNGGTITNRHLLNAYLYRNVNRLRGLGPRKVELLKEYLLKHLDEEQLEPPM